MGDWIFFGKYNQILSGVARRIARAPVLILVVVLVLAGIGMVIDDQIAIDTTEDSMVPSDMPAKVVMDKVTNLLGSQTSGRTRPHGSGPDLT